MQVQQIPQWIPALIAPLVRVIKDQFVSQVNDSDLQVAISDALDSIQQSAVILADQNPNNRDQLEAIWLTYVNKSVSTLVDAKVEDAISQIENETIRVPLETLRVPTVNMLRLVTDQDPNNKAQLEAQWVAFIKDAQVQNVFFGLITQIIEVNLKNQVKFIALALWSTLVQIIKGEIADI